MTENLDLAIRWPENRIAAVWRLGGVSLVGYPHHLRVPGGTVAVVGARNEVVLRFKAARIVGPRHVMLAGGQQKHGYIIKASPGTIRKPRTVADRKVAVPGWPALGAIRYFDAQSGEVVVVGQPRPRPAWGSSEFPDVPKVVSDVRFHARPYVAGIPGRPHGDPESQLVDAYVAWVGEPDRFAHPYLPADRFFADLFDRRYWRLFEAKAALSRRTIREAVGQLFDYRRNFRRSPSLGLLLPERPTPSIIRYLTHYRIAIIWRTSTGRFRDSLDGAWAGRNHHA